ncbi:hypothetical protein Bca4012_044633 [Brassica carinata]
MRLSYLFLLFQEMVQSLFLKRAKIQLSREQKGKAVARATESSPARVVESNSPSDFETINREAMMDTTNMDTPQRVLVAESARLIVREMVEVERRGENNIHGSQNPEKSSQDEALMHIQHIKQNQETKRTKLDLRYQEDKRCSHTIDQTDPDPPSS